MSIDRKTGTKIAWVSRVVVLFIMLVLLARVVSFFFVSDEGEATAAIQLKDAGERVENKPPVSAGERNGAKRRPVEVRVKYFGEEIDDEMQWALDNEPGMIPTIYRATERWDTLREEEYQRLLHLLEEDESIIFDNAEESWMYFVEADEALGDRVWAIGSLHQLGLADRVLRMVRDRARSHHEFAEVIEAGGTEVADEDDAPDVWDNLSDLNAQVEREAHALVTLAYEHAESEVMVRVEAEVLEAQRMWALYRDAEYAFLDMMHRKDLLSSTEFEKRKIDIVKSHLSNLKTNIYYFELQLGLRSYLRDIGIF